MLNIDLLFFFNILPFFDINHYFNAWILNYANFENINSKQYSSVKIKPSALAIAQREDLNTLVQADALVEPEKLELTTLDSALAVTAPSLDTQPAELIQTQHETPETPEIAETVEALNLEPVFSVEEVKLAFFYAEKELIETCVEAYTNKNFNLPLSYAPKNTSAETLELRKQEMITWLSRIKEKDEVHLFIKAIKNCSFDITKQSFDASTQKFTYVVDPVEFLKILTCSEHASILKQNVLGVLKTLRDSEAYIESIKNGSLFEKLKLQSEFGQSLREIQEPK